MPQQFRGLTPLIQVFDMTASLAFYRDRLGFFVVTASPEVVAPEGCFSHWVWLRAGSVDLMLNTAFDSGERPSAPDPARAAAHADTCIFIACHALDDTYASLTAAGLSIAPPALAPYGLRRFSVRDPDNFELVFQEYAPAPLRAAAGA